VSIAILPWVRWFQRQQICSNIGTKLTHHLNTRLGYGLGPLLFSPLSEIPQIGRNIPYATTFFLCTLVSIPLALVRNAPASWDPRSSQQEERHFPTSTATSICHLAYRPGPRLVLWRLLSGKCSGKSLIASRWPRLASSKVAVGTAMDWHQSNNEWINTMNDLTDSSIHVAQSSRAPPYPP
jgi:hypothetical protein